jgi:hypothetical protein
VDESGQNVIRRWLRDTNVTLRLSTLLQLQINLFESGGPEVLPGAIFVVDQVEGFYAMRLKAEKGTAQITPIFCYGPFSDTEIMFLAGAPIQNGVLKARDLLPLARHNRELLLKNPQRRRREPIA